MKSFVMNIWLTTWKKLYGDKVVDSLVSEFNIETSKLIIPTNDVPDDLVVRASRSLAQKVGKTYEELWEETGYQNIWSFHSFYPSYFRKEGVLSFLSAM
ncbi:MAG: heme NO-binding domain-containing protein, partial [Fervidobacterium sp.]